MDFQYWSCKSWVSVSVLDIEFLVLVLVLDKQVLNPSLIIPSHEDINLHISNSVSDVYTSDNVKRVFVFAYRRERVRQQ